MGPGLQILWAIDLRLPADPRCKGEGREGKREGGIGRNGRKGIGRKERCRGRKGGEEREGTEDIVKAGAALNKNSGDATVCH
jgi:hypothetical protein